MLQTSTYLPAAMPVMVKLRVSPGFTAGSPVSPTLAVSSTLSGSDAPTGSWSNGVSVLSTTISWSIVPVFLTVKVTSPAGTESGVAVRVIGPSRPFASPTTTWTVVPDDVAGTVTPPPPAVVSDD